MNYTHQTSIKDVKLGFLGYRDINDEKQFESYLFTSDGEELTNFIEELEATGGDDEAENIIGAFEKVNNDFSFSNFGTNLIILICDAPCHGEQYHDNSISDDYPKQPNNSLENQIKILFEKN